MEPEVDAERHLVHPAREVQVRGRGEDGVAAEDDEQRDRAVVHVGRQLAQRRELIHRARLRRRRVQHRLAHVAELRVDRVRERVHRRRLIIARDHDRRARVGLQVLGQGGDPGGPLRAGPGRGSGLRARSRAHGRRQRAREILDLRRA